MTGSLPSGIRWDCPMTHASPHPDVSQHSPHPSDANYDEALVPPYVLPDPLVCFDGTRVTSAAAWFERRRPELLRTFADEVYGRVPAACETTTELMSEDDTALDGMATRRELAVRLHGPHSSLVFRLLVWIPHAEPGRVPAFLGLNFFGNHSVHPDPAIALALGWVPGDETVGIIDNQATRRSRGMQSSRWPVELIVSRGYALATLYAGDIDPDFDDGFRNGVHPLFYAPGQERPAPAEWGSISAWAYGLSRALDALGELPGIDPCRVAVIGHSRLGKAALWAAAQDTRFALGVSNDSGCLGASLSRRRFGESVPNIVARFGYWFCENLRRHPARQLPVDQHELLALIAPRPVYVGSAAADLWADPHGEFLACQHAEPVYRLLGTGGFAGTREPPEPGDSVGSTIGYHIRPGGHDITRVDWLLYLAFADRHLKRGAAPARQVMRRPDG